MKQFHKCRQCQCKLPHVTEMAKAAFCCKDCDRRYYLRHCRQCGKSTKPVSPDAKGENFCSRSCKAHFTAEKRAEARIRRLGSGRVNLDESCPTAATSFLRLATDRPIDLLGGQNFGRIEPGLASEILATECSQTGHGIKFPAAEPYVPSVPVDDFTDRAPMPVLGAAPEDGIPEFLRRSRY